MDASRIPAMGKIEQRREAQDVILSRLASIETMWSESLADWECAVLGPDGIEAFCAVLRTQVDRVARLFGYDSQPFIG